MKPFFSSSLPQAILFWGTIFCSFTITSCKTLGVPKDTPSCLKSKIKQIKSDKVRNPSASVWQYEYKGQTVYYIPPYCCDMYSDLYDKDCNLICHPSGGITGEGDGKCSDFLGSKKNEKLIWQDDRK